jgi:carbon storage regulator CsrA
LLLLSRRKTQTIKIGGDITITIADISTGHVRVGVDAPDDVVILRGELEGKNNRLGPRRRSQSNAKSDEGKPERPAK